MMLDASARRPSECAPFADIDVCAYLDCRSHNFLPYSFPSSCVLLLHRCLKKYCICFSAGIKCDKNKCKCTDCGNGGDNSDEESATATATSNLAINDDTLNEPINETTLDEEPIVPSFADLMELNCVDTEPPLMIEDPPLPMLDVTYIEEV